MARPGGGRQQDAVGAVGGRQGQRGQGAGEEGDT
jgi:hypothetical protein